MGKSKVKKVSVTPKTVDEIKQDKKESKKSSKANSSAETNKNIYVNENETKKNINIENAAVTEVSANTNTERIEEPTNVAVNQFISAKTMRTVKKMYFGKKEITAEFTSNKKVRPNYYLSVDTVKKIDEIADMFGYKKSDFVDTYLNGTLNELLKKLKG